MKVLPKVTHKSRCLSGRETHLSLNGLNVYTVVMTFLHDMVSIMVLKDNDWYKQSSSLINYFKPEFIVEWEN